MESDHSFSGDSNSVSVSSASSSEAEEEALEPVHILNTNLELPQDLCEDFAIFKEFFSQRTWETLEEKHKQRLRTLLPTFPEDDQKEKEKTVQMLFSREQFRFSSPLNDLYNNLKQGNYRPDIAKMKKFLLKARTKQQRHKIKSYYAKLLPEVLISRERLLAAARAAPPGPTPFIPALPPKPSSKNNYKPPHVRARQRYFEELAAIRSEVGGDESPDENYPEGPPAAASRKRKHISVGQSTDNNVTGTLSGADPTHPTTLNCLKNVLAVHKARRHYRESHPELNTAGITLEDIKQRVAIVNGAKKLMFGSQKPVETPIQKLRRGSKKDPQRTPKTDIKTAQKQGKIKEHDLQSSIIDCKPLLPNIKIKCEQDESDSGGSSFVDPVNSPKAVKKGRHSPERLEIKKEVVDLKYPDTNNIGYSDLKIENVVKQEPQDPVNCRANQPVPIKLEDLDGIDMMALPVELADEDVVHSEVATEVPEPKTLATDESLMETTHVNFLCLVRGLFPARTAHRASRQQLHARCAALMRSPIAPLNTWYNLSGDWCGELDSALDFLAGEKGPHPDDYVPYLQFMPDTQMYQWIGAGRDCDAILGRLCERWLRARAAPPEPKPLHPPATSGDPLPSRYPTSWVVRSATTAELTEFRAQERRRFASAAKPFTYTHHGYRSVVGPCARSPVACSAHSSLLLAERPRHATFMMLVRDALARLPNGEGTRHDIVTLLRMSQWLTACSEQTLSSAASNALERMHSVKRDPVVKFDQRTATWTFLHRHRSEEDWAKSSGGRGRGRAAPSATPSKTASEARSVSQAPRDAKPSPQARAAALPPPKREPRAATPITGMELEVGSVEEVIENCSDSDVDVEDNDSVLPGTPSVAGLSSAQLLIQATQAKLTAQKGRNKPSLPKVSIPTNQAQQVSAPVTTHVPKPTPVAPPLVTKSALIKQRPLIKTDIIQQPVVTTAAAPIQQIPTTTIVIHQTTTTTQSQIKLSQGTRSLLIRPSVAQATPSATTPITVATQACAVARRGVVRVLSPAAPSTGKSLISPRALMQQGNQTPSAKRRTTPQTTTAASVLTIAQTIASSAASVVSSASSAPSMVTTSIPTRTVQLAGGRTVQLAANQTVHLPSGQAVQLAAGHTLQLSSLQLPTQCVRLPSGQTVQIATPQSVQALKTIPTTTVKTTSPRLQTSLAITKPVQQLPVSTVQLTGQTVQIAGQNVQITGHTVKLPSGQSVQVAGQSVQLSGQTVQLASGQNVQTVQLAGQTVQLGGQTVQLGGQTVQLANGQTIQLSGGQMVQTVQLANQGKAAGQHVVRAASAGDKAAQPIMAKLLTNAQGQMLSLEGMVGGARTLQISGIRPQGQKTLQTLQGVSGVRVVSATGARVSRPLLLTSAKPLHNIILQQSDGSSIRVTSSGGTVSTQTLVLSNIGGQGVTTSTSSAPVLKLHQVNPIHQVKLSQGIKIQQTTAAGIGAAGSTGVAGGAGAVRSVLMDGQQLKLVGGRHVLARLLRPANPH